MLARSSFVIFFNERQHEDKCTSSLSTDNRTTRYFVTRFKFQPWLSPGARHTARSTSCQIKSYRGLANVYAGSPCLTRRQDREVALNSDAGNCRNPGCIVECY